MLDEDDRGRARSAERGKAGEECRGAVRVEVRRRLVQDKHPRPGSQHAGEGESLLLAAGESRRSTKLETGEADLGQGLRHSGAHALARPAAVLETEGDVVLHPLHNQLRGRILEDDPDPTRERGRSDRADLAAVEPE